MQTYMHACMQQGRRHGFESGETKVCKRQREKKLTPTFNYHAMGYMTKGKIYLYLCKLAVTFKKQIIIKKLYIYVHAWSASNFPPLIPSVSRFSCPPVPYICTNTFRKCGDRFPPAVIWMRRPWVQATAYINMQKKINKCNSALLNLTRPLNYAYTQNNSCVINITTMYLNQLAKVTMCT